MGKTIDWKELILEELRWGRAAFDCWEGDPRPGKNELGQAWFIRPAIKGCMGKIIDRTLGGECIFFWRKWL